MLDVKKVLTKIVNRLTYDDVLVVDNVALDSSGSISGGGNCAVVTTDVSASVPSGYRLIWAALRGTQNASAVCWFFDWSESNETVSYRLRNVGTTAITTSPTANLLLVWGGYCVVSPRLSAIFGRRWLHA